MSSQMKVDIISDATGFDKGINSASSSLNDLENKAEKATQSLHDLRKAEQEIKNQTAELNRQLQEKKLQEFGKQATSAANGVDKLGSSISNLIPGFSQFSGKFQLVEGALKDLPKLMGSASVAATGMGTALQAALGPIGLIAGAVAAITGLGAAAAKMKSELDTEMSKVQAITGQTGESLDLLRQKAIQMSKDSGVSAGEFAKSFTVIGSKMPDLLQTSDALAEVGENANTLAKAGQMSADEAASAIATIINQFQVGMDQIDPTEKAREIADTSKDVINVLALAQQAGAADIRFLSDAITKSGTAAKGANIGYRELVAIFETLGAKVASADIAATGFNTVITKLESQANDKLKPSIVGVTQALKNLSDMNLDTAAITEMFGRGGGSNAAKLLMSNIQELEKFNETLNDTAKLENAAAEQARIMGDNVKGDINKLKGAWNGLLYDLGNSDAFTNLGQVFRPIIQGITDTINGISEMIVQFNSMQFVKDLMSGIALVIQNTFNQIKTTIDVLTTVGKIVFSVLETIQAAVQKVIEKCAEWLGQSTLFQSFKKVIMSVAEAFVWVYNKIVDFFNDCLKLLNKIREKLGLEPLELNVKMKVDGQEVSTGTPNAALSTPGGGSGSSGNGSGSGTTPKTIEPEVKSLKWYENEIQKLNSELTNSANIDEERLALLKQYNSEYKALKKSFDDVLKDQKEMVAAEGSLAALQKTISDLQKKKEYGLITPEETEELKKAQRLVDDIKESEKERIAVEKQIAELQKTINDLQKKEDYGIITETETERLREAQRLVEEISRSEKEITDAETQIAALNKTITELQQKEEYNIITPEETQQLREAEALFEKIKKEAGIITETETEGLREAARLIEKIKKDKKEASLINAASGIGAPVKGKNYSADEVSSNVAALQAVLKITADPNAQKEIQQQIKDWELVMPDLTVDTRSIEELQKDLDEKMSDAFSQTWGGVKQLTQGVESLYGTYKNLDELWSNPDTEAIDFIFAYADAIESTIDIFLGFADTVKNISDAFKAVAKASNIAKQAEQAENAVTSTGIGLKNTAAAASQTAAAANATETVSAEAAAMAEGTASGASLPFPANIAAIAAIVGSIVSVIAMIASLSAPKYATGGVAGGVVQGGGLTNGDRINIRVNKGEMILNSSQQGKLWQAINSGNLGASNPVLEGAVEFEIRGDTLYGVLSNYNKINNRR